MTIRLKDGERLITSAIRRHRAGGTCTADGRTLTLPSDFPERYVIGGLVPSVTLPAAADDLQVADAVDLLLPTCIGGNAAIGWWTADGVLWLDAVTFLASRSAAVDLGRARGELAIYDAHAGEVITLASVPA